MDDTVEISFTNVVLEDSVGTQATITVAITVDYTTELTANVDGNPLFASIDGRNIYWTYYDFLFNYPGTDVYTTGAHSFDGGSTINFDWEQQLPNVLNSAEITLNIGPN